MDTLAIEKELWKDIPGYKGLYQASTLGRIRSLDRTVLKKNRWGSLTRETRKGRLLKPVKTNGDYSRVTLSIGEHRKLIRIHSLVMLTFVGVRPCGELIRHLDGNPQNNNLSNLAYGTPRENIIDIYRYGKTFGILTPKEVLEIRKLLKLGLEHSIIARQFRVSKSEISMIKRGKSFDWLGDDGSICGS